MRYVVRPLPVLYACEGCPQFGQRARDAANLLAAEGIVETVWLGAGKVKPTSRFPIFAIDGCSDGCARRWLARHGITPQVACVL